MFGFEPLTFLLPVKTAEAFMSGSQAVFVFVTDSKLLRLPFILSFLIFKSDLQDSSFGTLRMSKSPAQHSCRPGYTGIVSSITGIN